MKKLMIAAAIVCAAAFAQAAQVQWSLTGIKDHAGSAPVAADGYTATLQFWAWDAVNTKWVEKTDAGGQSSLAVTSGTLANKKTDDKFAANTQYKVLLTIANDAWTISSTEATFTTPGNGNAILNFGTGQTHFDEQTAKIAFDSSKPNYGWTAVPEPTSGLLLLLGVAGLALRRRRA